MPFYPRDDMGLTVIGPRPAGLDRHESGDEGVGDRDPGLPLPGGSGARLHCHPLDR